MIRVGSITHDYLCFTCVLLAALMWRIIAILLTYLCICGFPALWFLSALMSSQRSSEFILLLCFWTYDCLEFCLFYFGFVCLLD